MIPWKPESNSLILRSKIIFSFIVKEITPLFPIDDMPHGYNTWHLKGKIISVNKGNLILKEDFDCDISIYDGPIRSRPLGIWINITPAVNENWTIFANAQNDIAAPEKLLEGSGKNCFAAFRSDEIKNDLEVAGSICTKKLSYEAAIKTAGTNIKNTGYLFYSFLWDTFEADAIKNITAFEKILALLENPGLNKESCFTLFNDIQTSVSLRSDLKNFQKIENRFVILMFRLLSIRSENDFLRNLIETYIPSFIGIGSGMRKRSADEVFAGHEDDKKKAENFLRSNIGNYNTLILINWMNREN